MLVNDPKQSSEVVVAENIVIAETWNKQIYKFCNGNVRKKWPKSTILMKYLHTKLHP
jgi:hypothetical protein